MALSVYFNKEEMKLDIQDGSLRGKFQRQDGKEIEIDVLAGSSFDRAVLVEVKKAETKTGVA